MVRMSNEFLESVQGSVDVLGNEVVGDGLESRVQGRPGTYVPG